MTTHAEPTTVDPAESPTDVNVDIDQLIRDLDTASDHFPEQTLRACQQHRDLVIPRLIDVLHEAARLGRNGIVREGQAPFYALFLLGEFRATEALPALMDVLNLPNNVPDKLFEDAITEILTRVLAALAASQPDRLDALIRNPALNEFVRWSACDAFALLVRDQRLDRQTTVARLRNHLQDAIAQKDGWGTTVLISTLTLATFHANEALDDIRRAFELELVDESVIDMNCVEESLHLNRPESSPDVDHLRPTGIADTVEELRKWHWAKDDDAEYRPSQHDRIAFLSDLEEPRIDAADELIAGEDYDPADVATIRHDTARVGRNDPCPCGSGKKYKKCCLRNLAPKHD